MFRIDIVIPSDYPFSPPKMKFETKGKVFVILFEVDCRYQILFLLIIYYIFMK